jgi:hypothetical protein
VGAARTITSVFCPKVGLVSFEIQGDGKVRELAALEHYGPRIDPMVNDVVTARKAARTSPGFSSL